MNKTLFMCAITLSLGLLSLNAKAQNYKVGFGAAYGSNIENVAIQGGAVADFTDQFRGAADFKYFFPDYPARGENHFWEINANLHYILLTQFSTKIYGLAGINIAHQRVDAPQMPSLNRNDTKIGLNLGAGAEYDLGFASIFGELKYAISDYDQFDIAAGLRFGL